MTAFKWNLILSLNPCDFESLISLFFFPLQNQSTFTLPFLPSFWEMWYVITNFPANVVLSFLVLIIAKILLNYSQLFALSRHPFSNYCFPLSPKMPPFSLHKRSRKLILIFTLVILIFNSIFNSIQTSSYPPTIENLETSVNIRNCILFAHEILICFNWLFSNACLFMSGGNKKNYFCNLLLYTTVFGKSCCMRVLWVIGVWFTSFEYF